ncbi:hypothetical protein QOZ80_7BG0601300 [Eleusine coracana subsp. coracana]|nr:hypothetical protein QOZ80_7BG0601300 [Eleusine coracana subsp. coracana]
MAASMVLALLIVVLTPIAVYLVARTKKPPAPANLPPGSLGLPVIGQSLGMLRAMRSNTGEQWIKQRIARYGPVSKLSLFGAPTVFVTGPAANKLVFSSDALAPKQPRCLPLILGRRNILELVGDDYRRVRGAMMQFLKPDSLRRYVGAIDAEVARHLDAEWAGRRRVTVLPLMKLLTFDIIATLLFGLDRGAVRRELADAFADMLEGMWSVPLDLPFTAFRRSLRASKRARRVLEATLKEKRDKLERGESSPADDLLSCLASLRDEGSGRRLLTDEEIVDNAMVVLVAGHDTSSVLMTFMMRHLVGDPATLATMVQEHDEIAKNTAEGEALTWEDLHNMRFTWRVALETLRLIPPIFGSFRRALEDIEFDGYLIPKGWQVFWASSVTHMDPGIFPEPDKFDPSRFETQAPPYSFVAFGGGQRLCAGIEFARVETLVTMHHLVRRFRWRLCSKANTFVRDPMPSPLHGLPIELQHKDQHDLT